MTLSDPSDSIPVTLHIPFRQPVVASAFIPLQRMVDAQRLDHQRALQVGFMRQTLS